jgi:hypothetical protein
MEHAKHLRFPLTPAAMRSQHAKFKKMGAAKGAIAVEAAIEKNKNCLEEPTMSNGAPTAKDHEEGWYTP